MSVLTSTGAAVDPLWRDLDLSIAPGEFLTVLGPNGVGKSTLLNVILGTRRLSAGQVEVGGNGRVGFIPQQRMFDPDLPIRVRDLVGLAIGHGTVRNRRPSRATVDAALAEVGASGLASRRVGTLSGGQQQRVRQAQALANDPDLLLCDEPLRCSSDHHQPTVDLGDAASTTPRSSSSPTASTRCSVSPTGCSTWAPTGTSPAPWTR